MRELRNKTSGPSSAQNVLPGHCHVVLKRLSDSMVEKETKGVSQKEETQQNLSSLSQEEEESDSNPPPSKIRRRRGRPRQIRETDKPHSSMETRHSKRNQEGTKHVVKLESKVKVENFQHKDKAFEKQSKFSNQLKKEEPRLSKRKQIIIKHAVKLEPTVKGENPQHKDKGFEKQSAFSNHFKKEEPNYLDEVSETQQKHHSSTSILRYGIDFYIREFEKYLYCYLAEVDRGNLSHDPVWELMFLNEKGEREVNKKLVKWIVQKSLSKEEVFLDGQWGKIKNAIEEAESQVLMEDEEVKEVKKRTAQGSYFDSLTCRDKSSELTTKAQVSDDRTSSILKLELGSDVKSAKEDKGTSHVNVVGYRNSPSSGSLTLLGKSSQLNTKGKVTEVSSIKKEIPSELNSKLALDFEYAEESKGKSKANVPENINPPFVGNLACEPSELNTEPEVTVVLSILNPPSGDSPTHVHESSQLNKGPLLTGVSSTSNPPTADIPTHLDKSSELKTEPFVTGVSSTPNPPSVNIPTHLDKPLELNLKVQVTDDSLTPIENTSILSSEEASDFKFTKENKGTSHANVPENLNPPFVNCLTYEDKTWVVNSESLPTGVSSISNRRSADIPAHPDESSQLNTESIGTGVMSTPNSPSADRLPHLDESSQLNTEPLLSGVSSTSNPRKRTSYANVPENLNPSVVDSLPCENEPSELNTESIGTGVLLTPNEIPSELSSKRAFDFESDEDNKDISHAIISDHPNPLSIASLNYGDKSTEFNSSTSPIETNRVCFPNEAYKGHDEILSIVKKENPESPKIDFSSMNGSHDPFVELSEDEEEYSKKDENSYHRTTFMLRIAENPPMLPSICLCYLTVPKQTNEGENGFKEEYSKICLDERNRIFQELQKDRKLKEITDQKKNGMKKTRNISQWLGLRNRS